MIYLIQPPPSPPPPSLTLPSPPPPSPPSLPPHTHHLFHLYILLHSSSPHSGQQQKLSTHGVDQMRPKTWAALSLIRKASFSQWAPSMQRCIIGQHSETESLALNGKPLLTSHPMLRLREHCRRGGRKDARAGGWGRRAGKCCLHSET